MNRLVQERLLICFWILLAVFTPGRAEAAASIFLIPNQAQHTLGSNFYVSVRLDTDGQAADRVEGVVSFDNSILQVKSVSTANSAVDNWLVEPTFVNNKGKISFVGMLDDLEANNLELLVISFVSTKIGRTEINISAGQVLAAGREEVNIAGSLGAAAVSIENPLSYDLLALEPNLVTSTNASTVEQKQLRAVSTEWLYRLLVILIALIVVVANWLVNRQNRRTNARKK